MMNSEQKNFIDRIGKAAQKYYNTYKILPSLTIAQAILESNWGKSKLSSIAFNYFGMKAGKYWTGATYNSATQEQTLAGQAFTINADFRAYKNVEEGIKGYYDFLNYARYANLKGITDYKKACLLIKQDGWATDVNYTNKLISLIENYKLTEYDVEGDNVQITDIKLRNKDNGYGFTAKGVLIDGVNYVAVRDVLEPLGKNVEWDNTNKEVLFSEK